MSMAGRCIAASTASGMFVGPGMLRNWRPLETVMGEILAHAERHNHRNAVYSHGRYRRALWGFSTTFSGDWPDKGWAAAPTRQRRGPGAAGARARCSWR